MIIQNKKMRKRKNEKGIALLLALMLTTGLIILGTGFFTSITSNSRLSVKTYTDVEALHITEAGIEVGFWEVIHGGKDFLGTDGWTGTGSAIDPWILSGGTISISGGPVVGEYVVYAEDLGSNTYQIISQGFFPTQANSVSTTIVKIIIEEEKLFQDAMTCLEELVVGNNSFINSYDSTLGLYGVGNIFQNGHLVTNSISSGSPYAVDLGSGSEIYGDVIVGPGVDPLAAIDDNSSVWTGAAKTLRRTKRPMDTPDISGLFASSGVINVSGGGTVTGSVNASGRYESLNVGNNDELTINGNITLYINGNFNMSPGAKIILSPGSSLNLFQNGNMSFSPSAEFVNQTQDPKRLTLLCTNNVTTVNFQPSGIFYGNVYMPNVDLTVSPNAEFFGSIFAKSVTMQPNLIYHFDESLVDDPNAPSLNQFNVVEWTTISQLPATYP